MSFSLPNPGSPTNGQPLDATPILQNFTAIEQAIDSFDGSQVEAKTITEQALADAINPRLRGLETIANFVYSGCVWSAVSGLTGTMTGGTVYVNGYRTIVTGIGSETFPASKDTYVDIDYLGNVAYQSVSNGAAAPSLTANSIRVAKVVTGASAISSVAISGMDSLGNVIYPASPRQQDWFKHIPSAGFSVTVAGTWTYIPSNPASSGIPGPDSVQSAGAQNEEIQFFVNLAPGTYKVLLHCDVDVNRGIYTLALDGSSIGTFDSYAATRVVNTVQIINSAFVVSSNGMALFDIKMATKNASSSAYFANFYAVDFVRVS